MVQNNSNDAQDPKNKNVETGYEKEINEEPEEGYDILPSNGPGLTGDDGEQVVDSDESEEFDEDVDDDDDE